MSTKDIYESGRKIFLLRAIRLAKGQTAEAEALCNACSHALYAITKDGKKQCIFCRKEVRIDGSYKKTDTDIDLRQFDRLTEENIDAVCRTIARNLKPYITASDLFAAVDMAYRKLKEFDTQWIPFEDYLEKFLAFKPIYIIADKHSTEELNIIAESLRRNCIIPVCASDTESGLVVSGNLDSSRVVLVINSDKDDGGVHYNAYISDKMYQEIEEANKSKKSIFFMHDAQSIRLRDIKYTLLNPNFILLRNILWSR